MIDLCWKTSTSAHRSLNLITSIGSAVCLFFLLFSLLFLWTAVHAIDRINSLRTISFSLDGFFRVYDFMPNPLPFRWDYACCCTLAHTQYVGISSSAHFIWLSFVHSACSRALCFINYAQKQNNIAVYWLLVSIENWIFGWFYFLRLLCWSYKQHSCKINKPIRNRGSLVERKNSQKLTQLVSFFNLLQLFAFSIDWMSLYLKGLTLEPIELCRKVTQFICMSKSTLFLSLSPFFSKQLDQLIQPILVMFRQFSLLFSLLLLLLLPQNILRYHIESIGVEWLKKNTFIIRLIIGNIRYRNFISNQLWFN